MKKNNGIACFVSAGLFSLVSSPARAEGGTVDIVLAATSDAYSVQMGDTTVTARGGNGTATLIHSSGGPFVDGVSANIRFASFSRKTISGTELEVDGVATFSSDDSLLFFERRSGDLAVGAAAEGMFDLIGGSGRFIGVSGQCDYKVNDVPGYWNVNIAKCQWIYTFPYR